VLLIRGDKVMIHNSDNLVKCVDCI